MEKECERCGREFEGRADARFCSAACRVAANRADSHSGEKAIVSTPSEHLEGSAEVVVEDGVVPGVEAENPHAGPDVTPGGFAQHPAGRGEEHELHRRYEIIDYGAKRPPSVLVEWQGVMVHLGHLLAKHYDDRSGQDVHRLILSWGLPADVASSYAARRLRRDEARGASAHGTWAEFAEREAHRQDLMEPVRKAYIEAVKKH